MAQYRIKAKLFAMRWNEQHYRACMMDKTGAADMGAAIKKYEQFFPNETRAVKDTMLPSIIKKPTTPPSLPAIAPKAVAPKAETAATKLVAGGGGWKKGLIGVGCGLAGGLLVGKMMKNKNNNNQSVN